MSAVVPEIAVVRTAPAPLVGGVLAVLLLAMGAFVAGIGLGWVPSEPGSVHAPRWVVVVCGAMFACGGIGVLANALGRGRVVAPLLGAAVLLGLALVCHWAAFAEGERRFTATTYVGALEVERRAVDERTGRTAFAVAAVSLDLLLLLVAARAWRTRRRPAGD